MKLPLSWLSDYTDLSGVDAAAYAHLMTMSGSKVEGFRNKGEGIENVVTGKIIKIEPHPDADKLRICTVDVGKDPLQIVTGAPNVNEGDIIPVALVGARLPGGVKISKGKLRGVESFGMMCSTNELGMSEEPAEGVLILPPETEPGQDIKETLSLNDSVIEFEITSNRADCFSVIGLARETAATLDRGFCIPAVSVKSESGDVNEYLKVRVENKALCPRYTARVVKNVKIEESPEWLRRRLMDCGVRAINNIVDITNYVMLEYGQPMHAFDIRDLEGAQIIIKNAGDGETMHTLDGIERRLSAEMLTIRDAKKSVAVAGVMGGENSEIKEDTTTVVFESANFSGISVRKTAQKLGLRTESSARFEKGLDAAMTKAAVDRACQLVELLGAGEVVAGVIDVDDSGKEKHTIAFRPDKINAFLGTQMSRAEMEDILTRFECTVENDKVVVPSFRADVEREADVAEEIARIFGYDKIPSAPLFGETTLGERNAEQRLEVLIKRVLTGCGCYEIKTYSFTAPKMLDALCLAADSPLRRIVKISNPLGEETSIMRTTALIGMLETIARNVNQRVSEAKIFEYGRIYLPKEDARSLPEEKNTVTIGMYGDYDFYDIKGILEELLESAGIKNYQVFALRDHPTYHPGKAAQICIGKTPIAVLGELHPSVLSNFDIKTPVLAAEIDADALLTYGKTKKTYQALPKYPAVSRDLAMLVDDGVMVGEIEEILRKNAGALLEELQLFDVYQGAQIPAGKKSVAYAIALRAPDRTLQEEEIQSVMQKIVSALSKKLDAQLREA